MKTILLIFCILSILLLLQVSLTEDKKKTKKGFKNKGPVIGIDLGTTFSCVSIYRDGEIVIIPNELGSRITPSVVSFDINTGERLIGQSAKNYAPTNPKNTLYDVKRLIGRRYSEVLVKDAKLLTYDLTKRDERVYIKVKMGKEENTTSIAPEEVSAMVLQKMKKIAEKYLGEKVYEAIITVPAYFNDQQKTATRDAGKIAGLNVLRVLNEPTAASMAYGLYKKKEENVLVFDLGGGTFDVSLLSIDDGIFKVEATSGDTHLGGEDFDLKIVEYFLKKLRKKHPKIKALKNLRKENKKAFQKLKQAAEKAKRELSSKLETRIEIENFLPEMNLSEKLTRAQFEQLNRVLFRKTLRPVKQVLKDSELQKSDIDQVILVGGSTRIPKIQEILSKFFKGKKLNKEINPDEAVAIGAAIQGAILSNEMKDRNVVLIDVNPLSLGIETVGGVMATLIPRNTHVPIDKSDIFTTTEDYQRELIVPIYEGERRITKYNRLLGELLLTGIPPAPKGVPQIKVTFKLDRNGILSVIAEDMGTKNKKQITIKKGTLSKSEIQKMEEDAKKNAEIDKRFLEKIETRQKLTSYIDDVKMQLSNKNIVNRLKATEKKEILKHLKKALEWLKKDSNMDKSKTQYERQLSNVRNKVNPILSSIYGNKGIVTDDEILQSGKDKTEDEDEIKIEEEEKTEDDKPIQDVKDEKKN